jgi:hypothetical protein
VCFFVPCKVFENILSNAYTKSERCVVFHSSMLESRLHIPENLARYKHSSLIVPAVSNKEKKVYNNDTSSKSVVLVCDMARYKNDIVSYMFAINKKYSTASLPQGFQRSNQSKPNVILRWQIKKDILLLPVKTGNICYLLKVLSKLGHFNTHNNNRSAPV